MPAYAYGLYLGHDASRNSDEYVDRGKTNTIIIWICRPLHCGEANDSHFLINLLVRWHDAIWRASYDCHFIASLADPCCECI